jgi:sporulation protein YlmC with PRC-barrel domain
MGRRRVLYAEPDLLDRQLVDADGVLIGKVDDLELSEPADGPPHVVAILSRPAALGPRLGRRVGRWLRGRELVRIPFGEVCDVDTQVTVRAGVRGARAAEDWLREHVIDKIPGARHADR